MSEICRTIYFGVRWFDMAEAIRLWHCISCPACSGLAHMNRNFLDVVSDQVSMDLLLHAHKKMHRMMWKAQNTDDTTTARRGAGASNLPTKLSTLCFDSKLVYKLFTRAPLWALLFAELKPAINHGRLSLRLGYFQVSALAASEASISCAEPYWDFFRSRRARSAPVIQGTSAEAQRLLLWWRQAIWSLVKLPLRRTNEAGREILNM